MLEHREILAPYPGLRPFEAQEMPIFFGREEHVSRLIEILHRERFLAVIGPSGSGKSSLVRAGMLPALATGWTGPASEWRMTILRPGDRPMRSLARALLEPGALGGELYDSAPGEDEKVFREKSAASIEAELRRGSLGLVELVGDALAIARANGASQAFNLLVLIDQFEEIFRYANAGAVQSDESDAFVNLILRPRAETSAAAKSIHVALTMRSDFLGNCVRFLELPEAINNAQYLTPRLTRDQLAATINEPARVFGGTVEAELVNEMINGVFRDPDQLPVLQHALARMWEAAFRRAADRPRITRGDLHATGGITEALSRHADEVLGGLTEQQQQLAELLFRAITDRGTPESGGRDTRRPQTLTAIARSTGRGNITWKEFVPIVEAYGQEGVNFLSFERPLREDSVIDISHESLIRQWQRLQGWVADEAERARQFRRWRDRRIAQVKGGTLLADADLAAALQWREGNVVEGSKELVDGAVKWRPTAAWAERYTRESGLSAGGTGFDDVLAFIGASEAKANEALLREEQRRNEELQNLEKRRAAEEEAADQRIVVEQERAAASRQRAEAAERARNLERERREADERAAAVRLTAERERAETANRERERAESSARNSRRIVALVALLAILAAFTAFHAYVAREQAKAQQAIAEAKSKEAETQKSIADARSKETEKAKEEAETQRSIAELKAIEALDQKRLAEALRGVAQKERTAADTQRKVAEDSLRRAKVSEDEAIRQRSNAQEAATLAEASASEARDSKARTESSLNQVQIFGDAYKLEQLTKQCPLAALIVSWEKLKEDDVVGPCALARREVIELMGRQDQRRKTEQELGADEKTKGGTQHRTVSRLIKDIEDLQALAEKLRRAYDSAKWQKAIAAVSQHYNGLKVTPKVDLVPLGADSDSKLSEFVFVQSGAVPERIPQGRLMVTAETGVILVLIPGGTFKMGSEAGGSDERPPHTVTVPPFFMAKHELTQGQLARLTGKQSTDDGQRPAVIVSFDDVKQLAVALDLRLPTEAEWEFAARAGTTTQFWWGEKVDQDGKNWAHCTGCGSNHQMRETAPVGSFPPNPFGLYDTAGNVWEWVEDCYHGSYAEAPTDGSAWVSGSCKERVLRGGSGSNGPEYSRSASRFRFAPSSRSFNIGVRLARTLP